MKEEEEVEGGTGAAECSIGCGDNCGAPLAQSGGRDVCFGCMGWME